MGIEAQLQYVYGVNIGGVLEVTGQLSFYQPARPDVACVSTTSNCLVAWEQWYNTGQSSRDIKGRLVHIGDTMANQGDIFPVVAVLGEDVHPAVASMVNGTSAQFLVVCNTNYNPWTLNLAAFDGSGGIDYGRQGPETNGAGFPAVASNPYTHEYLVVYPSPDGSQMMGLVLTTAFPTSFASLAFSGGSAPVFPAAAGSEQGFLVAAQDRQAGFTVDDIFGRLWGNRLYLPLAQKKE